MIDLQQLLNLITGNLGTLVLLAFILYGGFKRWWVFGWIYDSERRRADTWEKLALRATSLAEVTAPVAADAGRVV